MGDEEIAAMTVPEEPDDESMEDEINDIPEDVPVVEEVEKSGKEEVKKVETKKEEEKIPEITFDEFEKISLKVGEILECKRHENADKLLVSKIKIGNEIRQIVSGIAKFYEPSDLIGKKVIVVTNLKPIKIRGVESFGMVLCASNEDKLEIVEVKDLPSGSIVK